MPVGFHKWGIGSACNSGELGALEPDCRGLRCPCGRTGGRAWRSVVSPPNLARKGKRNRGPVLILTRSHPWL